MHLYRLALTRLEVDAIKTHERAQCELCPGGRIGRGTQVKLRHLLPSRAATVVQRQCHIQTPIPSFGDAQVRVFEARIGQSETKWEQRRDLLLIVPAIA